MSIWRVLWFSIRKKLLFCFYTVWMDPIVKISFLGSYLLRETFFSSNKLEVVTIARYLNTFWIFGLFDFWAFARVYGPYAGEDLTEKSGQTNGQTNKQTDRRTTILNGSATQEPKGEKEPSGTVYDIWRGTVPLPNLFIATAAVMGWITIVGLRYAWWLLQLLVRRSTERVYYILLRVMIMIMVPTCPQKHRTCLLLWHCLLLSSEVVWLNPSACNDGSYGSYSSAEAPNIFRMTYLLWCCLLLSPKSHH